MVQCDACCCARCSAAMEQHAVCVLTCSQPQRQLVNVYSQHSSAKLTPSPPSRHHVWPGTRTSRTGCGCCTQPSRRGAWPAQTLTAGWAGSGAVGGWWVGRSGTYSVSSLFMQAWPLPVFLRLQTLHMHGAAAPVRSCPSSHAAAHLEAQGQAGEAVGDVVGRVQPSPLRVVDVGCLPAVQVADLPRRGGTKGGWQCSQPVCLITVNWPLAAGWLPSRQPGGQLRQNG